MTEFITSFRHLLTPFVVGLLASIGAAVIVLLMDRLFLRRQGLLLARRELELQRELLHRHLDDPRGDKRTLEATDQLLARAARAYQAGIYDAAIIIAASALESRIRSAAPSQPKDLSMRELFRRLSDIQVLDPKDEDDLYYLWDKRNKLMHRMAESEISKSEAEDYLERTNAIMTKLAFKSE